MANHREYYKVEGGGLSQVQAVVSFMNPCMQMAYLCTKSVPTTH
jgi:hypothetical protein